MNKNNCLICSKPLIYQNTSVENACSYCGESLVSQTCCEDGHFVCDNCHSSDAKEIIKKFCIVTSITDPYEIAITLMQIPQVKMHGPEHHFLVPAALIAAYFNMNPDQNNVDEKIAAIEEAEKRAKNVLGGFCGFYGSCGAAIGTGIFVSIITKATPLSRDEWRLANLITGNTLLTIADHGGPRCCKRNTFLAIHEAYVFLKYEMDITLLVKKDFKCEFKSLNSECRKQGCPYY